MMKRLLNILLFFFFLCTVASAQPLFQEKRIYLLDVTGSMEGRGIVKTENIFDIVKENLSTTISHIEDPNTEIVVVPFTNTVFEPIAGYASQKDSLISCVRAIGVQSGDTNIADAWSYGVSQIDTTKINYMFLLTDGIHNNGPSKQVLYDRLNDWISYSDGKYMYAFYVMLVENAWDAAIRDIADADDHDNLQSILGMDIDAALMRTSLKHKKNLYESNSAKLTFTNNNKRVKISDVGIDIEMEENPYYSIEKVKKALLEDSYTFKIVEKVSKVDIPYNVSANIYITHNKEQYPYVFMTPSKITLDIYNHGPSIAYVSDKKFEGRLGNVNFGKIKFKEPFRGPFKKFRNLYEPTLNVIPFKWCIKRDTVTLYKDLYLSFNDEAVRSEGEIYIYPMATFDVDEQFLDIRELETRGTDVGVVLPFSIKVLPGSSSTTFIGDFYAYSTGIDKINKDDVEDEIQAFTTWSVKYKQKWTLILWLLWIILTLLVIALIIAVVGAVGYVLLKLLGIVGRNGVALNVPQAPHAVSGTGASASGMAAGMTQVNTPDRNLKRGEWKGDTYVFNPDYVIPNGNSYNNIYGQTIREMGEDVGDPNPAVTFDAEGNPVFDRDFHAPGGRPMECVFENGIKQYLSVDEIIKKQGKRINRENLHNEAFKKMADKYGRTVEEIRVFKGDKAAVEYLMKLWNCSEQEVWVRCGNPNRVQRVLHECADGKTVQLVPRLYHNPMVKHSGGIERVCREVLGG